MVKLLVINFVKPMLRRAGSLLAAYLIAKGVQQDAIGIIIAGIETIGLVGMDLIFSAANRSKKGS